MLSPRRTGDGRSPGQGSCSNAIPLLTSLSIPELYGAVILSFRIATYPAVGPKTSYFLLARAIVKARQSL